MDNTPDAAAAPATEATPNTSSNPASEAPAQLSEAPVAPQANIPADQVEAWNKFVEANGGFEKAFGKMKQTISNPPKVEASGEPQAPAQPIEPQIQQQVSQEPYKPEKGFITSQEYFSKKYNEDLASEYPEIADYINKGEYLKEATAMGMKMIDQAGNMNDEVIHKFLDMKKAAVAPAPTSTPVTTTPTVDYVHAEGDITTQEMADDIMKQGNSHPRYAEALKFTQERIFGKNPETKQK